MAIETYAIILQIIKQQIIILKLLNFREQQLVIFNEILQKIKHVLYIQHYLITLKYEKSFLEFKTMKL